MVIAETSSGDNLLLGLDDRHVIGALILWQVHCNNCNPHPVTEGGEIIEDAWCSGCYWWDVDRIITWSQLMEWQRHLSEKNWFKDTAWAKLLRQLDDPKPSGLRFAGVITSRAHRR